MGIRDRCNDDNGDTAWYYLQELFDGITKYFEKLEEENGYALTSVCYTHLDVYKRQR